MNKRQRKKLSKKLKQPYAIGIDFGSTPVVVSMFVLDEQGKKVVKYVKE